MDVPKKLIIMLITMPISWYVIYGPPLKNFIRGKYLSSLMKQCGSQQDPRKHDLCILLGKSVLNSCDRFIHIASLNSRLPQCIAEEQLKLKICLKVEEPETCLARSAR